MQGPEPADHDDFDQPGVDALLRRLAGDAAHAETASDLEKTAMRRDIFQPPDDLSGLRGRLQEIDRRIEAAGRSGPRPIIRRLYAGLAAAAVIGITTGIYFYVQSPGVGPGGTVRIAMIPVDLTRGRPVDEFRVGDKVRLDVTVSHPCTAYVAMLDTAGKLTALEPDKVHALEAGVSRRLPGGGEAFELDGASGTESFLLLISAIPLEPVRFREIVETAAAKLTGDGKSHETLLAEAIMLLRRDSRISVEAYTYQLLPATP